MTRRAVSWVSLVVVVVGARPVLAMHPPVKGGPEPGVLEVVHGSPVRTHVDVVRVAPAARAAAWKTFTQGAGGQWEALWDAQTQGPLIISGSGLAAPGTVASATQAAHFVSGFLARHIDLLAPGSTLADLQLVDNNSDGQMRTVALVQTFRGLPIIGADLIFEFKNDRLFVFGSTALPDVLAPMPPATPDSQAIRQVSLATMADLGRALAAVAPQQARVLPLVRVSGAIEYRTVLDVQVSEPNGLGSWTVYVDPISGQAVAREDNLRYATGTLKFSVPERGPMDGMRREMPAPLANITVMGMDLKTDRWGVLTWPGTEAATVTTNAVGSMAAVTNTGGMRITGSVMIAPGGSGVWSAAANEKEDAQLTTFISLNVVKQHLARFVPRGQMPWLETSVTARVNQPQTCNAFWDGTAVNFFVAGAAPGGGRNGDRCENTGRITDIVYHEFGHGVHQHALMGNARMDSAESEGVGDTLAFTITNDPKTGRGFFINKPMEGVRDADAVDEKWPPQQGQDPHLSGVIYSGYMYDLRKNLASMHGAKEGHWQHERLFYEGIRRATSIPTSYTQTIAADDDDGDVANGTPHVCAINEAGARHNLAMRTGANLIPWVAPPTLSGQQHLTLNLVGNDLCPTPVDLMTASVDYQPRDGMTPTTLTLNKGASGEYGVDLPSPGEDKAGLYKVTATFANGKTYTYPDNPAAPLYEFYTGAAQKLYCTSFDDATAPADWTHTGTPATADEWEWGPPGEIAGTNDPRAAFSGNNVFGMDLGKWTTDGVYPAGSTSALESPTVTTTRMRSVRLQYRRQLNVESGMKDQASIYANDAKVWSNSMTMNHVDKEWRFHDIDITAQAKSGSVKVKFELVANETGNMGGWNIDDFCIVGIPEPVLPEPPVDAGKPDGGLDGGSPSMDGKPGQTGGGGPSGLTPQTELGCSCHVAGGAQTSPALLLALMLLGARRRRR